MTERKAYYMRNGKFPCFHCGAYEVIWNGDFMASEYGYEVEGIIHECSCQSCGAQITYYVPDKEEEGDEKFKCKKRN